MLPYILHFMMISQNQMQMDINCSINKSYGSNESSPNDSFISKKSYPMKKKLDKLDIDEDIDYLEYFVYNPYWTLRKCSSKLLEKISSRYPIRSFTILKPFLENDLQCSDWIKR